jgi:hypothetical protein
MLYKYTCKMQVNKVGFEGMHCTHMVHDSDECFAVVNMVMKL